MDESVQGLASDLQRSSLLYRGQSKVLSCLFAQRAIQRRSLNEIAEEQVRRGQIRRRCLDEI